MKGDLDSDEKGKKKNVSESLQDSGEKDSNTEFKIRHLILTSRSLKFHGYYPNSLT